jgi:hypothetical protein
VEPAQRAELGIGPLRRDHLLAERGAVGHGPVGPGLLDPPPLQVPRVAVEEPVLGAAVAFRREQAGLVGVRYTSAEQEDVGLLAGLQHTQLGVDRGERGDQPVGVRSWPALPGGRLVPGGPAVALGQAVDGVEGVLAGKADPAGMALVVAWFVVVKSPFSTAFR